MHGPSVTKFLLSGPRNQWLIKGSFKVYLRKSRRKETPDGPIVEVVDLSSVEIAEKDQRKGWFSEWLQYLERMTRVTGFHGVFVENVLNPHLEKHLIKMGYAKHFMCSDPTPCYYKPAHPDK